MTTHTITADQQRAYRAVLTRLADLDENRGSPADLDYLREHTPLTRAEQAAIVAYHGADFSNELSVDSGTLIAWLLSDYQRPDLLQHVREAIANACWTVLALDLTNACQEHAEQGRDTLEEVA
jgi:hypothetical protein